MSNLKKYTDKEGRKILRRNKKKNPRLWLVVTYLISRANWEECVRTEQDK